jgi:Cytochrome c7 and related cytochrome c
MSGRLVIVACFLAALAAVLRPALAVTPAETHGLHPLPDDRAIPPAWLPPGAPSPDSGPSAVVYPPQKLTIRFNHKKHITEAKATCAMCHSKAKTSTNAADDLIPAGTTCDACHDTDHTDLSAVKGGTDAMGQCQFCHLGYTKGSGNRVVAFQIPAPNMRFNHKAHLDRNIQCAQCHGSIDELELATRDQLPRMKGCFGCHNMSGAAQGGAKNACNTCHTTLSDGRMKTMFASGTLEPPRWLHNAQHTPDWIERHKRVAADDSQFCASCHAERYCTDCHDGKVRPRTVHPNDWLSMHPIAARQDNPRCTSCHQEQSFCLDCHMRAGVTMGGANSGGHQFHPAGWAVFSGRGPGHHAWEAQRNINACVSCHTERDCATCHAAVGRRGLGVDPHPAGFQASCATQFRRNSRPCLVCHEPGSNELMSCN